MIDQTNLIVPSFLISKWTIINAEESLKNAKRREDE